MDQSILYVGLDVHKQVVAGFSGSLNLPTSRLRAEF
jgi:hypothetical protein